MLGLPVKYDTPTSPYLPNDATVGLCTSTNALGLGVWYHGRAPGNLSCASTQTTTSVNKALSIGLYDVICLSYIEGSTKDFSVSVNIHRVLSFGHAICFYINNTGVATSY